MQTISVLLKCKVIVNCRKLIIRTVCFFCILVTLATTEHSRVSYVYYVYTYTLERMFKKLHEKKNYINTQIKSDKTQCSHAPGLGNAISCL